MQAKSSFEYLQRKNLLDVLELSDCWRDRNNITSETSFVLTVKKTLKDMYIHTWEKQSATSNNMNSKLDFTRKFNKITYEQFLMDVKNEDRRNVTRFQISVHKYPVEI